MRTSASKSGGWRWVGGASGLSARLLVVGGASAALVAADASCSLIVDTNANQCNDSTVNADCGHFPGLRSCQQGVCAVPSKPPSCTKDSDCAAYANATCSGGTCTRPCSSATDCGSGSTCGTSGKCAETCSADADCGAGRACTDGVCGPGAQQSECKVNADCSKKGTYYICRKDTLKCVDLQSPGLCTSVIGDYTNDDAVIFGSILPTTGPDQSTGVPLQNAIKLAINDFTTDANGLPPATGQSARRPIVVVGCSDNSDSPTAVSAAQHLVDDVGVPAIIGAAFSGITISVATKVTIPAKVMLFSPSATSVAITTLDTSSPRLVWRSSPADNFQAQALSLYTSASTTGLEAQVRSNLGLMPSDKIKVTILHKGDAYGSGLASALEGQLMINGAPALGQQGQYQNLDYGNPDDPKTDPPNYGPQVAKTIAQQPHIVFVFGTNEAVQQVFQPIDKGWTGSAYYPLYVFSDGGEIPELWQYVAAAPGMSPPPPGASTLRARVSGSVPGTDNSLYQAFLSEYAGAFSDGTDPTVFGAAGAYDITYMLAYATSALLAPGTKSSTLTGQNLATAMSYLVPGSGRTELDVGGNYINPAFGSLLGGTGIDFNGASGPLNFDVKHGEAPSDVQIWCINNAASNEINSGLYYDAANTVLAGAYTKCN
jgi:ABC-type branched-subunit amino acid transport system substrate-binding protein